MIQKIINKIIKLLFVIKKRYSKEIGLFFFGLLLFLIIFAKIDSEQNDFRFLNYYKFYLEQQLSSIFQGFPYLSFYEKDGTITNYLSLGHDHGVFFIIPAIAYKFKLSISEAGRLFTGLMLGLLGLILPLLFYKIFHSVFVSIITSFFLLILPGFTDILAVFDTYWIEGWTVFLGTWMILLLFTKLEVKYRTNQMKDIIRSIQVKNIILIIFISLILSFSNMIRINTGLSSFISLLGIIFYRVNQNTIAFRVKLKYLLILLIFAIIPYLLIYPIFTNSYIRYSYNRMEALSNKNPAIKMKYGKQISAHATWHNIYRGLGYVRNDHGIVAKDMALNFLTAVIPTQGYGNSDEGTLVRYTPRYNMIVFKQILKLCIKDPWFIARNLLVKTWEIFNSTIQKFNIILFLICFFVFYFFHNKLKKPFLYISLPMLIINILPGILTIPYYSYIYGWYAVFPNFIIFTFYLIWNDRDKINNFLYNYSSKKTISKY